MKKVIIAISTIAMVVMAGTTVKSPTEDATVTTVTKVATSNEEVVISKVANKNGGEKVKPTKDKNKKSGKKDKPTEKKKQKRANANHGATPKNDGSVVITHSAHKSAK